MKSLKKPLVAFGLVVSAAFTSSIANAEYLLTDYDQDYIECAALADDQAADYFEMKWSNDFQSDTKWLELFNNCMGNKGHTTAS